MNKIDINADLGESFGAYTLGNDSQLLRQISSANIACGFHAGDPAVMRRTVALARSHGVACGAHPGYRDLEGFGRRAVKLSTADAEALMIYQLGALAAFAAAAGTKITHVKPHGALYNTAARDIELARALCRAARAVDKDIIFVALAGSCMVQAAAETGLRCASEVFSDRAYRDDGTLVPRGEPGAVLVDAAAAAERVVNMVRCGCVRSLSGREIPLRADTVCVHGDSAGAVQFAALLRQKLSAANIRICALSEIV